MANRKPKLLLGHAREYFPLKNIKIIIVDEDHETPYKQAETLRYHARNVAICRTKLLDAVCIF
jgi:primosomal protein N' (replication factor Y)